MNINFSPNINFQKKLVAKTNVCKANGLKPVEIYQLDSISDAKELTKTLNSPDWEENDYLEVVVNNFRELLACAKIYEIVDPDTEEMLSYCVYDFGGEKKLDFIETMRKHSIYNYGSNREYKYLGETMLAFLAKMCLKRGDDLKVGGVKDNIRTKNFYFKHCKFDKVGKRGAVLRYENLDKLIAQNEQNTKTKIRLVG